jgi:Transposase
MLDVSIRNSSHAATITQRAWDAGSSTRGVPAPRPAPLPLPSAQRTWLLLRPAAHVTEADQETLERFLVANPTLAHGYALRTDFQTLLAQRYEVAFDDWLQDAKTSDLPSFQTVARSFR